MADWGPVVIAVVLFVLFTPGLLFQIPGRNRVVEFGNMHTSGVSILDETEMKKNEDQEHLEVLLLHFVAGIGDRLHKSGHLLHKSDQQTLRYLRSLYPNPTSCRNREEITLITPVANEGVIVLRSEEELRTLERSTAGNRSGFGFAWRGNRGYFLALCDLVLVLRGCSNVIYPKPEITVATFWITWQPLAASNPDCLLVIDMIAIN